MKEGDNEREEKKGRKSKGEREKNADDGKMNKFFVYLSELRYHRGIK